MRFQGDHPLMKRSSYSTVLVAVLALMTGCTDSPTIPKGTPTGPLAARFTLGDLSVSYDFAGFTGTGFSPTPAAGQLDSDDIIVTGLSAGDLMFGDVGTTGDYARGPSRGGVSTWHLLF